MTGELQEPNPFAMPVQTVAVVVACPPDQLDAYYAEKPAVFIMRMVPLQVVDFYRWAA